MRERNCIWDETNDKSLSWVEKKMRWQRKDNEVRVQDPLSSVSVGDGCRSQLLLDASTVLGGKSGCR